MAVRQPLPEQDLRHVMAARRELIEHLLLGDEPLLLHPVERAREVEQVGDPPPVAALFRRVAGTGDGLG